MIFFLWQSFCQCQYCTDFCKDILKIDENRTYDSDIWQVAGWLDIANGFCSTSPKIARRPPLPWSIASWGSPCHRCHYSTVVSLYQPRSSDRRVGRGVDHGLPKMFDVCSLYSIQKILKLLKSVKHVVILVCVVNNCQFLCFFTSTCWFSYFRAVQRTSSARGRSSLCLPISLSNGSMKSRSSFGMEDPWGNLANSFQLVSTRFSSQGWLPIDIMDVIWSYHHMDVIWMVLEDLEAKATHDSRMVEKRLPHQDLCHVQCSTTWQSKGRGKVGQSGKDMQWHAMMYSYLFNMFCCDLFSLFSWFF